jgi:pimeloyl-ACP methyl ester carboxylesterase
VRWRYKNRSVSIVGISFGFLVVTRMLQKYPDIVKKVDLLVSGAGFAHKDDLAFSRNRHIFYRSIYTAFLPGPTAFIFRYGIINSLFLRTFYGRTHNAKNKFDGLNEEQKDAMTQFEIRLWHENDVRTWLRTCQEMLTLDNCHKQVDLPLWHIQVEADKYFNNDLVKQHLHIIFSDVFIVRAKLTKHSTDIIANAAAWNSMLPPKLKRELRKNP